MGADDYDHDHDHDHENSSSKADCSTNWTIHGGSLNSCITFDSPDSESTPNPHPLLLHQPSPDSPPCQINLRLAQKHEIRQVYVRSTARLYEIYYADTEYLCTARCSPAERDGHVLQPCEDDWVEVKAPHSPAEDLYEATAQISDADPCMSVTIRFLSLQNKGSVFIDEVYIFGDPVDSNVMETPAIPMENHANSFMAMLLPTLLQLSKSGINSKQDKDVFDSKGKETGLGIAVTTSDFTSAKKENDQEETMSEDHLVQLNVTDKPVVEPDNFQPLTHEKSSKENYDISSASNDASQARIERALEQLLDRVNRIENICLKFEETLVSPMNTIELRLQRLEQQVDSLAKNSQHSGVAACTRITAPSFSYSQSNSSSSCGDESEDRPCGALELEKDVPCIESFHLSDDIPASSNPSHALPNHMIAAPEFLCGEDKESNVIESAEVSSQEKQKKVLTIDDALAAALSGFLSTSHVLPLDQQTSEVIASGCTGEVLNEKKEFALSAQSPSVITHGCTLEESSNARPSKYIQILAVTAPDFAEDYEFENLNFVEAASATAPELASEEIRKNEIVYPSDTMHPGGSIDLNRSKSMHEAILTHAEPDKFLNENVHLKETCGIIGSKDYHDSQENNCQSQDDAIACPSDQDVKVAETSEGDSTNAPQASLDNVEDATVSKEDDTSRCSTVLPNVCDYLQPSTMNFDIPILDVKFAANEDSNTKCSLESLLGNMEEITVEAPSVDENADGTSEGTAIIAMDDEQPKCSADDSNFLVNYGIYAADASTIFDGLCGPSMSSDQEVFINLI